jgi:hypothetical protein
MEELPVKRHDVAVSGLTIGPEEEEGQIEVAAVDPGMAPPAPWPPGNGLGQLEGNPCRILPLPFAMAYQAYLQPLCKTSPADVGLHRCLAL